MDLIRRERDLFTIPPDPPDGADFRMVVAEVFYIRGRGAVVTGTVESGTVRLGSRIAIEGDGRQIHTAEVRGVEQFRRLVDHATAGDHVGLVLPDLTRDDLASGDVLRG